MDVQWQLIPKTGAAIEKALSPFVFKRERGTAKKALSKDLSDLEDERGVR